MYNIKLIKVIGYISISLFTISARKENSFELILLNIYSYKYTDTFVGDDMLLGKSKRISSLNALK